MKYSHGGNIREAIEKFNLPSKEIVDFSANINPLGPSPKVKAVIKNNLEQISHYPDPECKKLKKELSRYLAVDYKNVIVGNGSAELIYLAIRTLSPKIALIPIPNFSEYERTLLNVGAKIKFLNLNEDNHFCLNPKEVIRELEKVDLVFLSNPNNPTGSLVSRLELLKLIRFTKRKGIKIILDETFIDFREEESLVKDAAKLTNLFILRSFSKFFGFPGLRLGCGIGNKDLIKRLELERAPWTVNALAQLAGIEALRDRQYIIKTHKFINKESQFLFKKLLEIEGIKPYPSSANFILIKILKPLSSTQLRDKLGKGGIIIRDCHDFRGLDNRFIRVAVRTRKENLQLLDKLWRLLERLS